MSVRIQGLSSCKSHSRTCSTPSKKNNFHASRSIRPATKTSSTLKTSQQMTTQKRSFSTHKLKSCCQSGGCCSSITSKPTVSISSTQNKTLVSVPSIPVKTTPPIQPKKKFFVLGASGQLGMATGVKAVQEGYHVYGTSRNTKGFTQTERFRMLQTPQEEIHDYKFWKDLFICHLERGEEVTVVNTIGGAHAPEGKKLRDINVTPVVAAAQGLDLAARGMQLRVRWIHDSSIAASLLEDEYGDTKRESEEELAKIVPSLTVMRVGYAFNSLKKESFMISKIDMEHGWGPEQMAGLPFQFLFEHGNHMIQPVYVGDIIDAKFNAPFDEGCRIIHAVGQEVFTTDQFFKFFRDLSGKRYRPIYISYKVAQTLARLVPHGHFAPYAVEYCQKMDQEGKALCSAPFAELLGRPTTTMAQAYSVEEGGTLLFAAPPIGKHLRIIGTKVYTEPGCVVELSKCTVRIAWNVISQGSVSVVKSWFE